MSPLDPRNPPRRRGRLALAVVALLAGLRLLPGGPPAFAAPSGLAATEDDVTAARALFRANLDAIRRHDRDAYLACYLHAPTLARTSPTGFLLGYDSLAASAGRGGWPDHFEASDLRLVPVRDGIVYGTYRYRVRFGRDESAGLSERVFIKTPEGWRIAVTTAFAAPAGTPPPPRALVGATLLDGTGRPPIRNLSLIHI